MWLSFSGVFFESSFLRVRNPHVDGNLKKENRGVHRGSDFRGRCSNVGAHRTCQFVITVLTPATTRGCGIASGLDFEIYSHEAGLIKEGESADVTQTR
jgi:hypothetical protein